MQAVPPSEFLIKVIFCYHYFLYKVVFGERYRCVVGNRCKFRKCVGSYDGIMFMWKKKFGDGLKIFSKFFIMLKLG